MKKILLIMTLLLSLLLSFGCTNVEKKQKALDAEFGFSQEDFTVVEEYDTHAWMGDGRYYLTLDCSNNVDKANEVVKDWQKLPFTEDIKLIMYGDVQHGSFYERKDSNTKKQTVSLKRFVTSRLTWKSLIPWTDFYAGMLVSEKQRLHFVPHSRRLWTENRWQFLFPQRFFAGSITEQLFHVCTAIPLR
jgi:hypothetical protein